MKVLATIFCTLIALAQPACLTPNENLVVEDIPNPPLSLIDTADRYTEYRQANLYSWHPIKRQILIGTRFADTQQIHLVKFPLAERSQLTFFKDTANDASFQPTTGNNFVFSKDTSGNEFFQKYRYDLDNNAITLITDGKSRNTGGIWSHDGNSYAYGSTRRNGSDVDIYIVNPSDSKSNHMLVQLEGGGWEALAWSPDDKTIVAVNEVSANESYLYLIDTTSGKKELLTAKSASERIYYQGAQFAADGKGIYTTSDKDSEFKRLTYIDLATKRHSFLSSQIKWDVEDFDLTNDGKHLAFATNEDGFSVLHVLDTTNNKEIQLPELPKGIVYGLTWHKNNSDLGFTLVNSQSPADAYSLNIETGKVDRWTQSETGGIDTSGFATPELVKWKSFDGRIISGLLYRPPAKFTGKRPLLVNIHGGPEGQFRPYFLGRLNYYLNELGVAIIFPNVRGSTGYGKTFLKLDDGFKREDSYKDIGALFDWIKTRDDLDADRIMVTGGSYGGFMTLAVATNYADKIRCALDVVGPSNLVTFLENTESYRRDLRRVEYGDERIPAMHAFLEKIAPANHADKIKKPLFVVAGKNDPRVPASESKQMVAEVRKVGTPVWFLMANDEGHGFGKKKNIDFQFYSTIEFMQKYLLN